MTRNEYIVNKLRYVNAILKRRGIRNKDVRASIHLFLIEIADKILSNCQEENNGYLATCINRELNRLIHARKMECIDDLEPAVIDEHVQEEIEYICSNCTKEELWAVQLLLDGYNKKDAAHIMGRNPEQFKRLIDSIKSKCGSN